MTLEMASTEQEAGESTGNGGPCRDRVQCKTVPLPLTTAQQYHSRSIKVHQVLPAVLRGEQMAEPGNES